MSSQHITLSKEFIAAQRSRLEALEQELLGSEEGTIARERQRQEERGQEAEEREDDAQTIEQYVANQALRNVNGKRIRDVQRALKKIEEGTYGFSDESGEPIPVARLEAVPEAILTVEEQGRREAAA